MDKRERIQNLIGHVDLHVLDYFLKGYVKEGQSLLDAGCGEGRNLQLFTGTGIKYFGLDSDPAALRVAHTYLSSLDEEYNSEVLQEGTMTTNHFPDSCFDVILSISVLHHSKDLDEFEESIRGLRRMLKSNGSILIKMNSQISDENEVKTPYDSRCKTSLEKVFSDKSISETHYSTEFRNQVILTID